MSKRLSNILEGIGLLLILVSFLTQLVESDIETEIREAQHYQTQRKLDELWMVISMQYIENHPQTDIHKAINFESIEKNWKYYSEDLNELKEWQKAVWFQPIANSRIFIFTIGSLILLAPKFINVKE